MSRSRDLAAAMAAAGLQLVVQWLLWLVLGLSSPLARVVANVEGMRRFGTDSFCSLVVSREVLDVGAGLG